MVKCLTLKRVIRLGYTDGEVFGTILGNVDRITFGIDVGTELGYLDELLDGFNDSKLEG